MQDLMHLITEALNLPEWLESPKALTALTALAEVQCGREKVKKGRQTTTIWVLLKYIRESSNKNLQIFAGKRNVAFCK